MLILIPDESSLTIQKTTINVLNKKYVILTIEYVIMDLYMQAVIIEPYKDITLHKMY